MPESQTEAAVMEQSIVSPKRKQSKISMRLELDKAIEKVISLTHVEKLESKMSLISTIKKEIYLLQSGGLRGLHLQETYESLNTITLS